MTPSSADPRSTGLCDNHRIETLPLMERKIEAYPFVHASAMAYEAEPARMGTAEHPEAR